MEPTKDPKTGKWLIQYRYTDWQGNRKKSCKRGFNTKREANEWVTEFLRTQKSSLNMTFASFYDIYINDLKMRVEYIVYAMQLKEYGVKTTFIQQAINDLFGCSIALQSVSTI